MTTTSTTLTSWALLVWKALQTHGHDARTIFKLADLDSAKLGDGNARYRLDRMSKLWEIVIKETKDPCFGIEVGALWTATTFHALGFTWLASHTLKDALTRLVRYSRIVNNSLNVSLESHGANLHLIMSTDEDEGIVHDAARDAGMVAVVVMCRQLCGGNFSPLEIQVTRERSVCSDRLEYFVGTNVIYNCKQNLAVFDHMLAEQRQPTGNSELAKVNEEIAIKYLKTLNRNSVAMQVRSKLIEMMPSGQVAEEMVASELNLSLRSMQRKLGEEKTSFSALYKKIRQDMAGEYIKDSAMSMTEIAFLLGFSEQANFSRAYRRWYGMSPSAAREEFVNTDF
ncbi:MAG: AraC family transcriptional regulator [Acidiferrobacterales bacterium]